MKKIALILLALALALSLVACDVEVNVDRPDDGKTEQTGKPEENKPEENTPEENTPDNGGEPEEEVKITVAEALFYEKYMPLTGDLVEMGYEKDSIKNVVLLPMLTGKADAVTEFNAKILKRWENVYNILKNGEDAGRFYSVTYNAKTFGNYIGIIVTAAAGAVPGGVDCSYTGFYFDTENVKEISFDEYLAALGTNAAAVTELANGDDEYEAIKDMSGEDDNNYVVPVLKDAITDAESAFLCFESEYTMDGTLTVELDKGFAAVK